MNEEKKLTWKYFLKQKLKEISIGVTICLVVVFLPYYLGYIVGDNMDIHCNGEWVIEDKFECMIIEIWFEGFLYLIIVGSILWIVGTWLWVNWKKAKKKAKKDLRGKK